MQEVILPVFYSTNSSCQFPKNTDLGENDFLLILTKIFVADSDEDFDFSVQFCQIIDWKSLHFELGEEIIREVQK